MGALWRAFYLIGAGLQALDAPLQRGFNRAVHALMSRTGVTKRTLRRNGWGALLFFLLAGEWIASTPVWLKTMMSLLMVFIYARSMVRDDRWDEEAEQRGWRVSSIADLPLGAPLYKSLGWVFGALHVLELLVLPAEVRLSATLWLRLAVDVCFLWQGYLIRLPPNAPPPPERAPAAAALDAA